MRIYIKVFPRNSVQSLKQLSEGQWEARLTSVPEKGKANQELIKMLSKEFKTAKSNIEIVAGNTTKTKIVDILE